MVDLIVYSRILIAELYNESSVFNWDAITILVLVVVNIYYLRQIKKQIGFIEIDRLVKEMDNLIAPLYSKIGENDTFSEYWPQSSINPDTKKDQTELYEFWHNIEQYKYLGPSSLSLAIDNYRKTRFLSMNNWIRESLSDNSRYDKHSAKIAEEKLYQEITKRYDELQLLLSNEPMNLAERIKIRFNAYWPFSRD